MSSSGSVAVGGQNAVWNLGSFLLPAGQTGSGTLTINAGGTVTSGQTTLGLQTGSSATVHLNGNASDGRGMLVTSQFISGTNELIIFDGGGLRATMTPANFLPGLRNRGDEAGAGEGPAVDDVCVILDVLPIVAVRRDLGECPLSMIHWPALMGFLRPRTRFTEMNALPK